MKFSTLSKSTKLLVISASMGSFVWSCSPLKNSSLESWGGKRGYKDSGKPYVDGAKATTPPSVSTTTTPPAAPPTTDSAIRPGTTQPATAPASPKPAAPGPAPSGGVPAIGSMDNGWKLVWSDEFNGTTIDQSKWNFEILKPGAFNNELQGYTNRNENARIENGNLLIETRKDNFQGQAFTSARMNTRGKASWTYGRVEARIKVTAALGTWPAFWMMPEDQSKGWPACGEIDILEEVGYDRDVIHGTTHTQKFFGGNGRGGPQTVPNFPNDYHTYSVLWYKDRIDWTVDGKIYFTQKNDGGDDVYPFTKNFHIILNFALGGVWGGSKGVDQNMPNQRMLVDYVRVYQQ